jgi:hypothetical protein
VLNQSTLYEDTLESEGIAQCILYNPLIVEYIAKNEEHSDVIIAKCTDLS